MRVTVECHLALSDIQRCPCCLWSDCCASVIKKEWAPASFGVASLVLATQGDALRVRPSIQGLPERLGVESIIRFYLVISLLLDAESEPEAQARGLWQRE